MSFAVTTFITAQQVSDLFVSAIESSPNVATYVKAIRLLNPKTRVKPWYSDPKVFDLDRKLHIQIDHSTEDGEKIETRDFGRASIANALGGLARRAPRRYADILDETADADTADCFLQSLLYGRVVFS